MSAPVVLAVPAKGRLQENAEAFFARSGLTLIKPRGARDYRGAIAGLDGVEGAYLSASEITSQLAAGAVHLGVTGEDLVREMIPDADSKVVLIEGLGFGFANVVVAVPQAWIDVRTMADLDDVGTSFRHTHGRKMRVATKYINLTRDFFSRHGIVDYRIVESSRATAGAPQRLPRSARTLCRLRCQIGGKRQAEIRRRNAVRRADQLGHADAALPARAGLRAHQFPARKRRRSGGGGRSRLRVFARQSALRQARDGAVARAKRLVSPLQKGAAPDAFWAAPFGLLGTRQTPIISVELWFLGGIRLTCMSRAASA